MPDSKETTLELRFRPDSTDPATIRRFVESYFGRLLPDGDDLCRVAIAAHEFLENAVKYSSDGNAHFVVELDQRNARPLISLSLYNKASDEHQQQLNDIFAEMNSFTDAFEHYIALLRRPTAANASGVGLARVRAEGEMKLTLSHEGDKVCLRAQAVVGEGKGAGPG